MFIVADLVSLKANTMIINKCWVMYRKIIINYLNAIADGLLIIRSQTILTLHITIFSLKQTCYMWFSPFESSGQIFLLVDLREFFFRFRVGRTEKKSS